MNNKASILIVDDEEGIRHGLCRLFEREGFSVHSTGTIQKALSVADKHNLDIAILDVRLRNGEQGGTLLKELKKKESELPVIMITGYGSVESAVQAMHDGAADYILKPIDNAHLLETVRRYLELNRLKQDNKYLKKELLSNVYSHAIVSCNKAFAAQIALADRIKDSNAPVLLTGESGTGKEVFARHIHFTGQRKEGPFVGINCAALSEDLLLSELFGHEKGAFTGAVEKQSGKFELANGGTLFLDEIGDMAAQVQAKLLRVLEESGFERVGGTRRIQVDIRIIAATNHNLDTLIKEGRFRQDLLYRINTIHIPLIPLRQRPDDIPLLADFFMKKYAAEYRKPVESIAPDLMQKWQKYGWPGNVRELQNTVNQAVLLSAGHVLRERQKDHTAFENTMEVTGNKEECNTDSEWRKQLPALAEYRTLKAYNEAVLGVCEKAFVQRILQETDWNQSEAARRMDITRKTLARKISEYDIERS